jgi:hypothetical protein
MDILKSHLTLTKEETAGLLAADPFGLIVWGRTMRVERDAMSFAVHTELININNPTMGVYHCPPSPFLTSTDTLILSAPALYHME